MTSNFETVTSKDGTSIAYVKTGSGPAVVLVGGAFYDRGFAGELTGHLQAIAKTVPNGSHLALPGQFHQPDPEAMAAELKRFFL
jgi:hypothetical protein